MISKLVFVCLILFGCSETYHKDFILEHITTELNQYNGYLIDRDDGLHYLEGYHKSDSSFGIILVHGRYPPTWPTKGFEWSVAIKNLSSAKRPIWWFKHNSNDCPEFSSNLLRLSIEKLLDTNPHLDSLWIVGHSLGGLIVSDLAENWNTKLPISIHAIAAALNDERSHVYDCKIKGKKIYNISESVKYIQWRTVHKNDGAFKDLANDPQDVIINNGNYVLLPKTWKKERLGHNLSIQLVIKQLKSQIDSF